LANFNAGAADDPNESIFLFESANPYSGDITMLSGQKLIGQDAIAFFSLPARGREHVDPKGIPAYNNEIRFHLFERTKCPA
jgi:hypothetical protein